MAFIEAPEREIPSSQGAQHLEQVARADTAFAQTLPPKIGRKRSEQQAPFPQILDVLRGKAAVDICRRRALEGHRGNDLRSSDDRVLARQEPLHQLMWLTPWHHGGSVVCWGSVVPPACSAINASIVCLRSSVASRSEW